MTNSSRWKTLTYFLLFHAAALSGSATEIRLKLRTESRGSVVLLGDIAELKDDEAKSGLAGGDAATTAASLARIELFPAPGMSKSRTVRRREIRELLGLHGIDLQTVRFAGATAVVIQTRQRPRLRIQPATNSAATTRSLSAAQPIAAGSRQEPVTELVLAAVRDLQRGEIIHKTKVTLIPIPVDGKESLLARGIQPVLHPEEAIGMEVTRPIAANQPLDARTLKRPLIVRRGDLVTVTSRAPGVSVQTVARATENAALGDLLVLESVPNRKRYTARVTGNQEAEVYASGITVSSPPDRPAPGSDSAIPARRAIP